MSKYLFFIVALCVLSGLNPAVQAGDANWVSVPQTTVLSIYNIETKEADTLHIFALDQSHARTRCGGQGSPFVIFTDYGVPMTGVYAPSKEEPTGFVEVYYDRNGDGQADGTVLALDLSTQTDVWMTWRTGDEPGIVYLHPSKKILVAGIGFQTVYRPTSAQDSDVLSCNMGRVSKPGGHRQIGAYQMTPRWN